MHIFIGTRLRFWAVAQFIYDVLAGDKTFGDIKGSFKDQVLHTAMSGHLSEMAFCCLEEKRLAIGDPWSHPDEWYHDAIVEGLERYVKLGLRRGGMLAGYARAQIDHLHVCKGCLVCGIERARRDISDAKEISDLLQTAKGEPDLDRFMDDILGKVGRNGKK